MQWQRICAWCDKDLGMVDVGDEETTFQITHGICEECRHFFVTNSPKPLHEFINRFEMPLFVVDKEGVVCTTNKSGLTALDKNLENIEGQLGGNVFECVHSRKPGGCGKTTHCLGCSIRNTVTETYNTGLGVEKKIAIQELVTINGPQKMKILISTEKVNKVVLLRIDSMNPL